jgi:two-component system, LytTR family, response regulator
MLKSIIIDDEMKSLENLRILIQDFCDDVEVKALCQNVDDGIAAIEQHKPDVVFLDIQMQRETGFDLLTRIKKIDFDVIFTTAYSEYAIRAFRFSAIDYLLKPIDISELHAALEKVRNKRGDGLSERLSQLIDNLKANPTQKYKLALPTGDGLVFVKVEEIIYCEADSNYTQIYLTNGTHHIVSRTLKEYEEILTDQDFFRIHNSHLINLNLIKNYIRGDGGHVIMSNGKTLDVSKRKRDAFLSRLGH